MPDLLRGEPCVACRPDSPMVTMEEEQELLPQIPEWEIIEVKGERRLRRTFTLDSWDACLAFAMAVGQAAAAADHHPTMLIAWGKVTVTWWTHAIRGLHRNDLIMAAQTDGLYADLGSAHGS